MEHITGTSREQITLFPEAIEDYITDDNPVRFIDAFVDKLDLATLGFQKAQVADTGRPPYAPGDLLKLYLYGYLNRVRSSRRLERETERNVEIMWLLKKLTPDHKTISDFRKDNPTAIRAVCREFVVLCQNMDLFGADLVAVDGSKFRASNSKNRNFTKKKLKERLGQIDDSVNKYLKTLETNDHQETPILHHKAEALQEKIATLKKRHEQYRSLLQQLEESGETQVSLTDPDARQMVSGGKGEVAYNVQTVIDQKHKLIVAHEVTNEINDRYQLSTMAQQAKETLGVEALDVLADKGYATATEIKKCEDKGIVPYVSTPEPTEKRRSNVPTPDYYHSRFHYDKERDVYICPQQKVLTQTHRAWRQQQWVSIYRTSACRHCSVKHQCTINKNGRTICRSEHEELMARQRERISQHPEKLLQRKSLSEHPFGTLKHGWNQGYFLLRGLPKVRTEASLSVLAYNLRRAISVLGVPTLVERLLFSG
jgi:transposase